MSETTYLDQKAEHNIEGMNNTNANFTTNNNYNNNYILSSYFEHQNIKTIRESLLILLKIYVQLLEKLLEN